MTGRDPSAAELAHARGLDAAASRASAAFAAAMARLTAADVRRHAASEVEAFEAAHPRPSAVEAIADLLALREAADTRIRALIATLPPGASRLGGAAPDSACGGPQPPA